VTVLRFRRWIVTSGALLALVGSFLPWLRSGERLRSSYQLQAAVRHIGLATSGPSYWVLVGWPLLPVALAVAVALFLRRAGLAERLVILIVAAYASGVAAVALRTPLPATVGVPVTLAGAGLLFLGGLLRGARR
jgi:hypothetical protein